MIRRIAAASLVLGSTFFSPAIGVAQQLQAGVAWSRLGPAILLCVSQKYGVNGMQAGSTYGILPNDARYIGMIKDCMTEVAYEEQYHWIEAAKRQQQQSRTP